MIGIAHAHVSSVHLKKNLLVPTLDWSNLRARCSSCIDVHSPADGGFAAIQNAAQPPFCRRRGNACVVALHRVMVARCTVGDYSRDGKSSILPLPLSACKRATRLLIPDLLEHALIQFVVVLGINVHDKQVIVVVVVIVGSVVIGIYRKGLAASRV